MRSPEGLAAPPSANFFSIDDDSMRLDIVKRFSAGSGK